MSQSGWPVVHSNPASTKQNMDDQIQNDQVRLVLAAEPGLFRAGLRRFLASEPDFVVVCECARPAEAFDVMGTAIDVILLDFDVGMKPARDWIFEARKAGYQGRFLAISGVLDAPKSGLILKLGASGIFLKSEAPERLAEAIRLVAQGEAWVDPIVIQLIADYLMKHSSSVRSPELALPLDDNERNVLVGILAGLSDRKIADHAALSPGSVKTIVRHLFHKAGVNRRSQLVRVALGGAERGANTLADGLTAGAIAVQKSQPPRPTSEANRR
jgi:DNA-binding NarL/FixJ family response regulator